jgi:ketosteroid isomerase-like protein
MTTHTATASDVEVLRDLNGQYIHSVVHADVARFTEILADDFLCTNPDGSLVDKPQFLRQTAVPVAFTDFDVDDLRIRVLGDVAIVHGRTRFALTDGRRGRGQYTDVWEKRQGRWLAVSAHVTRVMEQVADGAGC